MYVLITDGVVTEYPYSFGQLKKDNPQTSFPHKPTDEQLAEWGVYPVKKTPKPNAGPKDNVVELNPVLASGEWVQTWQVVAASPDEIAEREIEAWASLRALRTDLLLETDWRVIKAVEDALRTNTDLTIPQEWLDYRQALRDVPQNTTDPFNPVWPVAPA